MSESVNATDHRLEHGFHARTLDTSIFYIKAWNQDMKNRFGPISKGGIPYGAQFEVETTARGY
jgi:hypothetical protein